MIVIENSRKIRPSKPGRNTSGMNTAASDRVIDKMVNEISPALLIVAWRMVSPGLGAAHDVFQEHHGVVHEEPDGQRQRHQREVIDAVTEQVHCHEGQQQRERQRDGGDQRVGRAAQEDEDHQHHQHERDEAASSARRPRN